MSTPAAVTPQFDPGSTMHAPELYQPVATGFGVEHLEDIGPREIEFYREHGYLIVRQAFTPGETDFLGLNATGRVSQPALQN